MTFSLRDTEIHDGNGDDIQNVMTTTTTTNAVTTAVIRSAVVMGDDCVDLNQDFQDFQDLQDDDDDDDDNDDDDDDDCVILGVFRKRRRIDDDSGDEADADVAPAAKTKITAALGSTSTATSTPTSTMASMPPPEVVVGDIKKNKEEEEEERSDRSKKPKRPLSAYNLFFRHQRVRSIQIARKQDVDKASAAGFDQSRKGAVFQNLAKHVGRMWRDLPPEEKAPFEARAAEERRRYEEQRAAWRAERERLGVARRSHQLLSESPPSPSLPSLPSSPSSLALSVPSWSLPSQHQVLPESSPPFQQRYNRGAGGGSNRNNNISFSAAAAAAISKTERTDPFPFPAPTSSSSSSLKAMAEKVPQWTVGACVANDNDDSGMRKNDNGRNDTCWTSMCPSPSPIGGEGEYDGYSHSLRHPSFPSAANFPCSWPQSLPPSPCTTFLDRDIVDDIKRAERGGGFGISSGGGGNGSGGGGGIGSGINRIPILRNDPFWRDPDVRNLLRSLRNHL